MCVSDGVTPSDGTPIHVHLVLQEGRGGQLQYQVLGLQPVAVAAMLPAALRCASALKFSTRAALVAHAREVERQFGLQMQANWYISYHIMFKASNIPMVGDCHTPIESCVSCFFYVPNG